MFSVNSLHAALPEYRLGDTAHEDVITPVPLAAPNAEATDALKRREATRVPMVFRINPIAAEEAEAELRASFFSARTNFDDALRRTMKGKPDNERVINSPLFQQAVASAKRRAAGFPLLDQLAPVWARNESDEGTLSALLRELRAVMNRPVIAGRVEGYSSRNSISLVTVGTFDETLTPQDVEQRAKLVRGDEVLQLPAAHRLVRSNLITQLSIAGLYLSTFVRTNAMADVDLTRILRAQRTENLAVLDNYAAGQTIIRKGQVVDVKMLAALTALREKNAIGALQTELAVQQAAPPPPAKQEAWMYWAMGGFGLIVGLLIVLLRRMRAVEQNTLLPVLARGSAAQSAGEMEWRERAMIAEARVEQAKHAMKGGFMQWMREKLVSGLFQQRAQLLSSQQKAEAEMRALDERLEQLHAPLQERIATYEARIADLEKDLAAKGAENRELIKAKISLAKHQLSVERERSRAGFGTN